MVPRVMPHSSAWLRATTSNWPRAIRASSPRSYPERVGMLAICHAGPTKRRFRLGRCHVVPVRASTMRHRPGWPPREGWAVEAGGAGGREQPVLGGVVAFGAGVLGVEGGAEVGGGGVEVAAYVDLVVAGAGVVGGEDFAGGVADVGQGYAGAQGLAPGAGGDLADG